MRSTFRSLTFGLATVVAGATMAQQPYYIVLQGTVSNCYPGQTVNVQTVQNTQPAYDFDVPVDPGTCTWSAPMAVASNPAYWQVSTQCNGMVVTASDVATFNFIMDTVYFSVTLDCGNGNLVDCNGVPNGPDLPGTPCDDGNPMTWGDLWTPACVCVGQDSTNTVDCLGIPGGNALPGAPCTDFFGNVGVWSADCICQTNMLVDCLGNPGGGALPGTACTYTPDNGNTWLTGIWGADCICSGDTTGGILDCMGIPNGPNLPGTDCALFGFTGTWDSNCVCVPDSSGNTTDCLGVVGGSALPGTPCTDFFGNVGVWTLDCYCNTNTNTEDCLGNPGGGALPGTPCVYTPDSGNTWVTGFWSVDCVCAPDTGIFGYDCLGVWNGPAQPGTPCTVPGTTLEGTWNGNCECMPNNPLPCEANFWVIQAMGPDSLPVPYELWVWNLSSGGSGNLSYLWNFGDGTSSTDAYPTHTYSGNGPYNLCLTISDNNGCTDTYCDSVSINADGIYEGLVVHAEDRQDGFTINVQDPNSATAVEEMNTRDMALWPNPVADELNVALNITLRGTASLTVIDLNGRVVLNERLAVNGRTQLRLATAGLEPGMYTLRISDGANTVASQRFVKAH